MSRNCIKIDFDNYGKYPVGTKVVFVYGAYYGEENATVTGFTIVPATKYFPAAVHLNVVTDSGEANTVSMFSDIGIGTRLISVPEAVVETKKPRKSPWAE